MSVYTWIIIILAAGWPAMFCLGLAIGHYVGRGQDDGDQRVDAHCTCSCARGWDCMP